jgi:hypothetical protein
MTACMGRSAGGKHSRSLHACAFIAPRIARALTPRTPLVAPRVRTAAGCRGPSLRAVVAKVSQTAPAVRIHLAPPTSLSGSVPTVSDEPMSSNCRTRDHPRAAEQGTGATLERKLEDYKTFYK